VAASDRGPISALGAGVVVVLGARAGILALGVGQYEPDGAVYAASVVQPEESEDVVINAAVASIAVAEVAADSSSDDGKKKKKRRRKRKSKKKGKKKSDIFGIDSDGPIF